MKQIFPKEIIHQCIQAYIPENHTKSKILYGIFLLLLLGVIISLPLIKVQVYSSARGLIKPVRERLVLNSLVSGKVLKSNLLNNNQVSSGDTLLIVQSKILDERLKHGEDEVERHKTWITDLLSLVEEDILDIEKLKSPRYQKEFAQYQAKSNEFQSRIKKLRVDHYRNKKLLKKGVISQMEYDNIKLEYDLAVNALNQFRKGHLNTWQALLTELEGNLKTRENENRQIEENISDHVMISPINGSLVNVKGIEVGGVITSGASLGEISPDSIIIAECYISPMDIGLLDSRRPVIIQIDAYNYNQWGTIRASILDIAKDVEFFENQPIYKVRCQLERHYLQLKNGVRGALKRGMTINARFELTERTLYQLLYDKLEDWVVPSENQKIPS